MSKIYVKYNPYRLETYIEENGNQILEDSVLSKFTKGKRLQEWIADFPKMLVEEFNTASLDIEFCGMLLDWEDFEESFKNAENKKIIRNLELRLIEKKPKEDLNQKIEEIFEKLQNGSVEDFKGEKGEKLKKAFNAINEAVFPINVIATMSSGKSTLINALLGTELMPAQNEACTATITEILDNDKNYFNAIAYNNENEIVEEIDNLDLEKMESLNADVKVSRIYVEGDIPFLDAKNMALKIVDTPGPNNAQNQEHKNTTYRSINNDSNSLILYVLNGTQLSTNDDARLLEYIAEQIKKGGKQIRDRFIFVLNKMDAFNPEKENIEFAIMKAKEYLAKYGIEEPQIFPCSAFAALNIRMYLEDVDIDSLSRAEIKKLPSSAQDTISIVDKLNDFSNMHLEKYTTISPSVQQNLEYRLNEAENKNNISEQALIHSGIYSIEEAIKAYVKKYAYTKKIKELTESFQEVLEENMILENVKEEIVQNEEEAKKLEKHAAMVKAKIANGEEAKEFREKVEKLNPLPTIEKKAKDLQVGVVRKTSKIFSAYGDAIQNKEEAKRLVRTFTDMSSDSIAELTVEIESLINNEVKDTGEEILKEYVNKLRKFDEDSEEKQLNFSTEDLIRGALCGMKEMSSKWCSDEYAAETIDEVGEVTYETRTYYEKTGQKEVEVADGTEKICVGQERVKVGEHKEKVGTERVKNPKKSGFLGFFKIWQPAYVSKDVYETVNDYEDRDVYETVIKYKKVMQDVYEERTVTDEKFFVEVKTIQEGLIAQLRKALDDGIKDAIKYAGEEIKEMKAQFNKNFDELDLQIVQKYSELEKCVRDKAYREAELQKSKEILDEIENRKREIEELLDL